MPCDSWSQGWTRTVDADLVLFAKYSSSLNIGSVRDLYCTARKKCYIVNQARLKAVDQIGAVRGVECKAQA
jgi:hypothetical protein